jgi:hypothetical protein
MTVNHEMLTEVLAAPAPRTELLAALHWNIVPPFAQGDLQIRSQAEILGRCVAAQVRAIIPPKADVAIDFALSSTVISGAITGIEPVSQLLFDVIETQCGIRPTAFLHTYMCTGWGYALSYFSRHTDARLLMLSIVDVDIHDLAYHRHHPQIGKLGFGLSTLLLRIADEREETAATGGPYPDSAFKEFIRAMKGHNARRKPVLSFIPFFGPSLGSIAESVLGKSNLGSNRHDFYGHCFGSDPWIGIIEWLQQNPPAGPINVTAGAVAFNGYYTLCDIGISPETLIGLDVVGGSEPQLEAAISASPVLKVAGIEVRSDVAMAG